MIADVLMGVGVLLLSVGTTRRGVARALTSLKPVKIDSGAVTGDHTATSTDNNSAIDLTRLLAAVSQVQNDLSALKERIDANEQQKYDALLGALQEAQQGAISAVGEVRYELARSGVPAAEMLKTVRSIIGDEARAQR